jgi:hypothetical protein
MSEYNVMNKVCEVMERLGEYKLHGEVFGFAFFDLLHDILGAEYTNNTEKYDKMIIASLEEGCMEWDV